MRLYKCDYICFELISYRITYEYISYLYSGQRFNLLEHPFKHLVESGSTLGLREPTDYGTAQT